MEASPRSIRSGSSRSWSPPTPRPLSPDEGLRERKKRRLRQRISNVATALFLAEGFEAVSVARIAARSEVSEQTVFNYFPTKESMFFDEADDLSRAIADAVRDPSNGRLSDVVRPALIGPAFPDRWPSVDAAVLHQHHLRALLGDGGDLVRVGAVEHDVDRQPGLPELGSGSWGCSRAAASRPALRARGQSRQHPSGSHSRKASATGAAEIKNGESITANSVRIVQNECVSGQHCGARGSQ